MNIQIALNKLEQICQEKNANSLSERLIFCLKYRGVSQTELAKAIGVTPQNIQALCAGKIEKSRHINEIAAYLNVNPIWLTMGYSTYNKKYSTQITDIAQIPVISWDDIGKTSKYPIKFTVNGIFDHADLSYALQVMDDSMSPKFEHGEILLISECRKATDGDYVIAKITVNNQYICRLFKDTDSGKLVAINPIYGVIRCADTNFEIVGVVKETRNNLKNG